MAMISSFLTCECNYECFLATSVIVVSLLFDVSGSICNQKVRLIGAHISEEVILVILPVSGQQIEANHSVPRQNEVKTPNTKQTAKKKTKSHLPIVWIYRGKLQW